MKYFFENLYLSKIHLKKIYNLKKLETTCRIILNFRLINWEIKHNRKNNKLN